MFDTHSIARSLTARGKTPRRARTGRRWRGNGSDRSDFGDFDRCTTRSWAKYGPGRMQHNFCHGLLSEANLADAQVDAITEAVRRAADHGDHVTSEQFKAGLAEMRTEIAGLRADLTWRMLAVAGLAIGALRLF